MTGITTYQDLYTHRKHSTLPPECQEITYKIGKTLKMGTLQKWQTDAFRESIRHISPSSISKASDEIRDIANLYRGYSSPTAHTIVVNRFKSLWKKRKEIKTTPQVVPETGWVFIFHGDGFLRQSGLNSLIEAPQSPFEFTAIVYRLNDWVENVRVEAAEYAKLKFPETNSDIIAESAFFLLEQAEYLVRWSEKDKAILEKELFRPDVLELLKDKFLELRPGRLGFILAHLLKRSEFDCYLEELANNAVLPQVRAVAFDTLINSRAKWSIGYKKKWIDKVYNISRKERVFETRKISHSLNNQKLLLRAATDKSSVVRKVAATALIELFNDGNNDMQKLAIELSKDKSAPVRMRAKFFLERNETMQV